LSYHLTADQCLTCDSSTFIDSAGKCINFPTGIYKCNLYKNATTCLQCSAPYYLESNTCILSTYIIVRCLVYQTDATCK
jgi:hypothetical protein